QDERFEVLEGTLTARIDGDRRDLGPGDVIEIPRRTPHQMWNSAEGPARAVWQTRPALRTEDWFRSIDALHADGRVGKDGMPGRPAFAPLLSEFDAVVRLSAGPELVTRPLVSVLGALGRARGYRPTLREK